MLSKPEGHPMVMTVKKIPKTCFSSEYLLSNTTPTAVGWVGLRRDLSERPPSRKGHQMAILGWQSRQKDYYPDFIWELISVFHGSHAFLRWANHLDNVHRLAKGKPQNFATTQDFRETVPRFFSFLGKTSNTFTSIHSDWIVTVTNLPRPIPSILWELAILQLAEIFPWIFVPFFNSQNDNCWGIFQLQWGHLPEPTLEY